MAGDSKLWMVDRQTGVRQRLPRCRKIDATASLQFGESRAFYLIQAIMPANRHAGQPSRTYEQDALVCTAMGIFSLDGEGNGLTMAGCLKQGWASRWLAWLLKSDEGIDYSCSST